MKLREAPVLVLFLIFSAFFCRRILVSSGVVLGGDWLFPITIKQTEVWAENGLYLWTNVGSLLGVAQSYIMLPIHLFFGFLAKLHIEGEIVTKFLLLFVPTFSGFAVYFWCRFLQIRIFPSLLGGFYFITTPLFFNYTIMGWAFVLLSGALLPFALILFSKAIREDRKSYAVLAGIIYFFGFCLASQAVVWYAIVFFLLSLFIVSSLKEFVAAIKAFIIVFSIFFLMNGSWIAPLLAHSSGMISQTASGTDVPLGQRLSFLNILRLWGSLFNFQYETTFPPSLLFLTFIPAFLSYLSLLLKKKNKIILFLVVLTFIPYGFYSLQKIYYLIPFTIVIRDPSRFIIISSLGYSVLIAYAIESLVHRRKGGVISKPNYTSKFLGCMLALLVGCNSYPFWKGELYATPKEGMDIRLRTHKFPGEYLYVEKMLKGSEMFKALYLPAGGFVGLLNGKKFCGAFHEFADTFSGFSLVPGTVGNKADRRNLGSLKVFDELLEQEMNLTVEGRPPSLFNLANIKYIIARLNMYSSNVFPSVKRIVHGLKSVPYLTKLYGGKHIVFFKNQHVLPKIYAASGASIISGEMRSLLPLAEASYLGNQPAFIFMEQNKHRIEELLANSADLDLKQSPILLVNKNLENFVLDYLKNGAVDLFVQKKTKDFKIHRKDDVFLIKLKRGMKTEFDIKISCEYEIWNLQKYNKVPIQIDGLALRKGKSNNKLRDEWIKRANIRLESGKHEVKIQDVQKKIFRCIKAQRECEFLLIPKQKIKKVRERFKNYFYVFLIYPSKNDNAEVLNKEIKKIFLFAQDVEYQFKGCFSLKEPFVRMKRNFFNVILNPVLKNQGFLRQNEKVSKGVDYEAIGCKFLKIWENDVLKLKAYFDSYADEFIKINYHVQSQKNIESKVAFKRRERIDLKKYPFLALTYKLQDPSVQTIQVVFRVQIENDKQEYLLIPRTSYPKKTSDQKETFFVNLLRKVQDEFPGRKHYYLTGVQILPHKIWGVDCSKKKKGWYLFELYGLKMIHRLPLQVKYDLSLKRDSESGWCYLKDGIFYFVSKLENIPLDERFCFKVRKKPYLDIRKKENVNLILTNYESDRVKASFGFRKGGDDNQFVEIVRDLPTIPIDNKRKMVHINLKEILKEVDNKEQFQRWYTIKFSKPGEKKAVFIYELCSNQFAEYKRIKLEFNEKDKNIDLFRLKGVSTRVNPSQIKRVSKNRFEFDFWTPFSMNNHHSLEFLRSKKFQWNWLMLLPKVEKQYSSSRPILNFEKLNLTRYVVNVKNAHGPFWMVFSESFHPDWKAYIRMDNPQESFPNKGESWSALLNFWRDHDQKIEIPCHIVVNGFANGWWVNVKPEFQGKDFQIVIEFTLQRWFELGVMVSSITFITALGCLGYCFLRLKRREVS